MKRAIFAVALAYASAAGLVHAQNATSGLSTVPGMNAESSGTVTGSGGGRDGAFGSPSDTREVGAARGSTEGDARGGTSGKGAKRSGRGTGTDERGSPTGGAEPR